MRFLVASSVAICLCLANPGVEAQIDPRLADYAKLAFYLDRWVQHQVPFEMSARNGKHVVLLTKSPDHSPKLMQQFVDRLDGGWSTYAKLIGKTPGLFRQIDGKATVCALPRGDLSCGYGCGYVGSTGVEVAGFYDNDWPAFEKNPRRLKPFAMPCTHPRQDLHCRNNRVRFGITSVALNCGPKLHLNV